MSKFKPGDRVRCISQGPHSFIHKGEEYVVREAVDNFRGPCICVTSLSGCYLNHPYEESLFELSWKPALNDVVRFNGKLAKVTGTGSGTSIVTINGGAPIHTTNDRLAPAEVKHRFCVGCRLEVLPEQRVRSLEVDKEYTVSTLHVDEDGLCVELRELPGVWFYEKRFKASELIAGRFRKGQRIVCNDERGTFCLRKGRVYTVRGGTGPLVTLEELPKERYEESRFAPETLKASSALVAVQKENGPVYKRGDVVKCVQGATKQHPVQGQLYKVIDFDVCSGTHLVIASMTTGVRVSGSWAPERFAHAKDPTRINLVVVESPYGHADPKVIEQNVTYLRACMADCLARGEAPYASHALYTQPGVLDDSQPEERKKGMEAGFAWGAKADLVVVYIDRGISKGMEEGIRRARENKIPVEMRSLAVNGASWRV